MIDKIIPLILFFSFAKIIKLIINRKLHKCFQEKQPDKLLQLTLKGANSDSDSKIISIANLALDYVYYGMYEVAEEQIAVVDWDMKPNRQRSFERRYQAIVQYLQYQNFEYGVALAVESKQLGKYNIGKASYNIIIQVGKLLNGDLGSREIIMLEKKFKRNKYLVLKLLIAWALANIFMEQNQIDKSNQYLKYCVKHAPWCSPFQNIFLKPVEKVIE